MTFSIDLHCTRFILLTVWCAGLACSQLMRRPSSPSEFQLYPSNTTVPEGAQTILKCMVKSHVHVCRWYFLELGLDFFSESVSPMLVKDFKPSNHRDCSIRIKKVRKIQEGQWLCQALKFHSMEFLMTEPVVLRVITRAESASWAPPSDFPPTTPRQGRHHDEDPQDVGDALGRVRFDSAPEDYIHNTVLEDSMALKCKVNTPIASCTWVMPDGSFLNVSQDEAELSNKPAKFAGDYRLEGDLTEGNCSLRVAKVQHRDEGDWRCVVRVAGQGKERDHQGPLLHLHITDLPFPTAHSHGGVTMVTPTKESSSVLIIVLVLVSVILLILVILLFSCLYRRVAAASDETHKILHHTSPRSSLDLIPTKTFPTTDLTSASVLAVEAIKSAPPKCVDLNNYNQYLDMNGSDATSTSYVIMPGSSLRSSTSSRTTLSTLSTIPVGRTRSASNSTVLSSGPSTLLGDLPARPDSLYCPDHVYEEIKERQEVQGKMEKIPEASTPTYTNLQQDCEGYMIPKKNETILGNSHGSDATVDNPKSGNILVNSPGSETILNNPGTGTIVANPVYNPPDVIPKAKTESPHVTSPSTPQAPPYSRVGENGLVPVIPTQDIAPCPDPGYSRVGPGDADREDVPTNPMERYDVPRSAPVAVPLPSNIPVSSEAYVNGLTGIIV